jgi:type II secretory pathway pseudopilin PulG
MSLIESAVAVVIAGTAFAAVTPSLLQSRETYVLTASAQDVATALYGAKIHAISEGHDCRLRVEPPAAYVVECQNAPGVWVETDRRATSKGITLTANNRPEFHPRGNVSPTATITVWNPKGRALRVIVNANGRVRTQ